MRTRLAALASLAFLFVAGHRSNADTLTNSYSNDIDYRMSLAGSACGNIGGYHCNYELDKSGIIIKDAIERNLYLIQNENTRIDALEASTQVTENTDRSLVVGGALNKRLKIGTGTNPTTIHETGSRLVAKI